jgi:hypothetical protein
MTFVIQHPGRIDLFCNGSGEYVPLKDAKQYEPHESNFAWLERGENMIATPAKPPIHPLSAV